MEMLFCHPHHMIIDMDDSLHPPLFTQHTLYPYSTIYITQIPAWVQSVNSTHTSIFFFSMNPRIVPHNLSKLQRNIRGIVSSQIENCLLYLLSPSSTLSHSVCTAWTADISSTLGLCKGLPVGLGKWWEFPLATWAHNALQLRHLPIYI